MKLAITTACGLLVNVNAIQQYSSLNSDFGPSKLNDPVNYLSQYSDKSSANVLIASQQKQPNKFDYGHSYLNFNQPSVVKAEDKSSSIVDNWDLWEKNVVDTAKTGYQKQGDDKNSTDISIVPSDALDLVEALEQRFEALNQTFTNSGKTIAMLETVLAEFENQPDTSVLLDYFTINQADIKTAPDQAIELMDEVCVEAG